MKVLEKPTESLTAVAQDEQGILAYGIAWLLGVPLTVLVIIWLIFGNR